MKRKTLKLRFQDTYKFNTIQKYVEAAKVKSLNLWGYVHNWCLEGTKHGLVQIYEVMKRLWEERREEGSVSFVLQGTSEISE